METVDQHGNDEDPLGVLRLLGKVFEHTLRMAGRRGIAVDEESIAGVVKNILAAEDGWTYGGDLYQALMSMLEIPVALGAYNPPMEMLLTDAVVIQIDLQRSEAEAAERQEKVADRRATLHVLRRLPPADKPKR